jgi:hypothetical protein
MIIAFHNEAAKHVWLSYFTKKAATLPVWKFAIITDRR